jgi:hypothetical protein
MLVKFSEEDKQVGFIVNDKKEEEVEKIDASDLIGEISRVRLSEDDLAILEKHLLYPPKPNEELVKANEEYEKLQMASLKDEVTLSDEEIMERARQIELKKIHERMEKIKKIQDEIRGYEDETEDPVGALANSEYRLEEKDETIDDDIKFSDDFIDEAIAEFNRDSLEEMIDDGWDVGVETIDIETEKTDEPVYQTESKELDKMMDIVNDAIDEKKK